MRVISIKPPVKLERRRGDIDGKALIELFDGRLPDFKKVFGKIDWDEYIFDEDDITDLRLTVDGVGDYTAQNAEDVRAQLSHVYEEFKKFFIDYRGVMEKGHKKVFNKRTIDFLVNLENVIDKYKDLEKKGELRQESEEYDLEDDENMEDEFYDDMPDLHDFHEQIVEGVQLWIKKLDYIYFHPEAHESMEEIAKLTKELSAYNEKLVMRKPDEYFSAIEEFQYLAWHIDEKWSGYLEDSKLKKLEEMLMEKLRYY